MNSKLFLFLFWGICSLCIYAQRAYHLSSDTLNYTVENFSFVDARRSLLLDGTLTIPRNFNSTTKVVVLVSPPQPIQRDYYGLFSTLARVLSEYGVATLRFDNRAYSDEAIRLKEDSMTMIEQANDVHEAVLALHKDKRFRFNPVGLLGHSEGGCSVAIEASRNENVNFAVVLSTCGIKGKDLVYSQAVEALNIISDNELKQNIKQNLQVNLQIVEQTNSVDSMRKLLEIQADHFYNSVKNKDKVFGKNHSTQMCIQNAIDYFMTPRHIVLIKYDPELYYSKLKCPLLAMCGKMDGVVDCKNNLEGIKNISKMAGKHNFEVLAIDSVDHGYKITSNTVPLYIDRISSRKTNKRSRFAIASFDYIAKWIKCIN